MQTFRRALLCAAAIFAAGGAYAADPWPSHPIHFVVPFGPGGANDLLARAAAEGASRVLGQPIIVDNKPGAGAVLGTDFVAKAQPDGYTFLISAAGVVSNSMIRKVPYKDADLVPVAMIGLAPSVIIVPANSPYHDLKDFVAQSKQGKGLHFSTAGVGSTPHFVEGMLTTEYGAKLDLVPYKSGGESVAAVLGSQVDATSEASIVVLPQIKAGKLKAIATTYDKISAAPEIPTTKEAGYPNVRIGHWAGVFAPKGTPQPILDRMNADIIAAVKSQEFHDKLVPSGIEPAPLTLPQYVDFIKTERERLGTIARRAKMQAD